MKILIIKTKAGAYIKEETKEYYSYLSNYLFDGKQASSTYDSKWFFVQQVPERIEKVLQEKQINQRWELKTGYPENAITPKTIYENPQYEDSTYYEVRGLYSYYCDKVPGGTENIPFEATIISELDNFEIIRRDFEPEYGILDKITIDPVLLPTKPCRLSSKDFYNVIRKHVKSHMNPAYVILSSDYDFCFTVSRRVMLVEPKTSRHDIGTKRRPKYVDRPVTHKDIKVFEMAPSPYNGYSVIEPLVGKNYEDMMEKLNSYLDELMKELNRPTKECPICKGHGILYEISIPKHPNKV